MEIGNRSVYSKMELLQSFGSFDGTPIFLKHEIGDGNCFYYAMIRGLHELYPEIYGDKSYMFVKKRLIQYYLENIDTLFANTTDGVEFAWYQFEQLRYSIQDTKTKSFRIQQPKVFDSKQLGNVNKDAIQAYKDVASIKITPSWCKKNIDTKVNNILSQKFKQKGSVCFMDDDSKRPGDLAQKCIQLHRRTILEEVPEIHVILLGLLQDDWYAGFRIISDVSNIFNIRPIILVGEEGALVQSPIDMVEDKRDVIYFHFDNVNHFNSIYYETKDKKVIKHTKKSGVLKKKGVSK